MGSDWKNVHKVFIGTILISLIGFLYGGRVKRNIFEFRDMVSATTGRDAADFYGYGHYCGLGGQGTTMDPIDECCKQHDQCYAEQKFYNCGIFVPKYSWEMTSMGVFCLDNPQDFCRRHLCECDKACAECFAATSQFYEPSFTRSVHAIAAKLFHILEPLEMYTTMKLP